MISGTFLVIFWHLSGALKKEDCFSKGGSKILVVFYLCHSFYFSPRLMFPISYHHPCLCFIHGKGALGEMEELTFILT